MLTFTTVRAFVIKVVEQDINIARDSLSQEEGLGRKLPNLRSLLERLNKINA